MLTQWDPFAEMTRLHDRMFGRNELAKEYAFRPAVDIYEDEQGVHVHAEIPGVKPEDIKVDVQNNVLTISGERRFDNEEKKEGYHRVERFYGRFNRSFALTEKVDVEAIDAKYEHGVLKLTLPKRPEAAKREIAVKAA